MQKLQIESYSLGEPSKVLSQNYLSFLGDFVVSFIFIHLHPLSSTFSHFHPFPLTCLGLFQITIEWYERSNLYQSGTGLGRMDGKFPNNPVFFPSATLSLNSCSGWFCVNETFRRVLLLPRQRNSMPRSGFHSQTICTALHTCTSLSCTLLHTAHCAHCVAHCTSYLHFVELHTAQCCCCYPGELHCNLWHSSVSLFQVTVRGRHGHGHKCYLSLDRFTCMDEE